MKKNIFWLMGIVAMLAACESDNDLATAGQVKMTFSVQGDFDVPEFGTMTRALTADGKQMTDLWVLDYVDGTLVQQLHQTAEDEDFGTPTMTLDYGSHHVYFVASRGKTPTLSTATHTIMWASTSDTFYKDYSVNVTSGTSASHSVTMERVATKLTVAILDEIPAGAATIELTPATWYYGLDYVTGTATGAMTSEPRVMNIPASYIGTTGEVTASIFGISGTAKWTTDVTIVARDGDDDILGQATVEDAPFVANRSTKYSGNLFSSGGAFALSLNGEWDEELAGTW